MNDLLTGEQVIALEGFCGNDFDLDDIVKACRAYQAAIASVQVQEVSTNA